MAYSNEYLQELRNRIIRFRKEKNMTQDDIAKAMGISRSSYAYTESKATRISTDFLIKLSEILDIPPTAFQPDDDVPHRVSPLDKSITFRSPLSTEVELLTLSFTEQTVIRMFRKLSKEEQNQYFNDLREKCDNLENNYE